MIFHSSAQKRRILSALLCGTVMLSAGAQALAADSDTYTTEDEISVTEQAEVIEATVIDDVASEETAETAAEETGAIEETGDAAAVTEETETEAEAAVEAGEPEAQDEQSADALPSEESTDELEASETNKSASLSQSGYALQRLGLVKGGTGGDLMLTKVCTREEALTLFLAVLGERETAENSSYTCPYTDVSSWAEPIVGYAAYKGYTNGTSKTKFSSKDTVTIQQYMTFILRALGYSDGTDFCWSEATTKAVSIGFCSQSQMNTWMNSSFKRQQIMEISYTALNTKLKGSSSTVADKLISMGVITKQQAKEEGLTYTGSTTTSAAESTTAASRKLSSVMSVYPDGTSLGSGYSFAGATQCMGFGREIFYRMYNETARWNYDGSPKSSSDDAMYDIVASSSSYSAASMKKLISSAKPGDILQMNSPKMHTMVFVSSDANGFTVYDANWVGANKVSVRYVSYGAWTARNSKGITLLHATNYPTA